MYIISRNLVHYSVHYNAAAWHAVCHSGPCPTQNRPPRIALERDSRYTWNRMPPSTTAPHKRSHAFSAPYSYVHYLVHYPHQNIHLMAHRLHISK